MYFIYLYSFYYSPTFSIFKASHERDTFTLRHIFSGSSDKPPVLSLVTRDVMTLKFDVILESVFAVASDPAAAVFMPFAAGGWGWEGESMPRSP